MEVLVRLYSTNAMRTEVLFMSWTAVYPAVGYLCYAARGRIPNVRSVRTNYSCSLFMQPRSCKWALLF